VNKKKWASFFIFSDPPFLRNKKGAGTKNAKRISDPLVTKDATGFRKVLDEKKENYDLSDRQLHRRRRQIHHA